MVATVESYNPFSIAIAGVQSIASAITSSSIQQATAGGVDLMKTSDGTTSISQSDFKNVGGVCKPMNFPALAYSKNLQTQMNRVAHSKGYGKIGEDGEIGPGTLALLKKIQAAYPQIMGNTAACIWIAADSDVIGDQVKQVADSLGVPAKVPTPPSVAASVVTKTGLTVIPPGPGTGAGAFNAFSGMSTGQKAIFGGLLGGIAYVVYKKSKKGKRR